MSTRSGDHLEQLLAPDVEQQLAEALRAAWAPTELDPRLNEQLVAAALEDPLAPPSTQELVESQRLRDALEGRGGHPDADLARALQAASGRAQLGRKAADKLVDQTLRRRPESNVIYVAFGVASGVAAVAAALALLLTPAEPGPGTAARPAHRGSDSSLALSRSTAPLFKAKFELSRASARVDRIALARARDLRHNRFAGWGVE
jgi:hypothetical protein